MDIKKESFLYDGRVKTLQAQSLVECRFPGEMATVLAVNATLSPLSAEATDGEVFYKGKLLLTVVYEDADKNVCRSERGMEFSHTIRDEACTPACRTTLALSSNFIKERREGSGLFIGVIVDATVQLVCQKAVDYVCDGTDISVKKRTATGILTHSFTGEVEADDEFETEYLGDVLLHSEKVNVTEITAEEGNISLSGEINLNICAMKEENKLLSLERLIPFRADLPCDGAKNGFICDGNAVVVKAQVFAEANEEKGKCAVRTEFSILVNGDVYEEKHLELLDDAFSTKKELQLKTESFGVRTKTDSVRFSERIQGTAILSGAIDFTDSLVCVLLPFVTAEVQQTEEGERIDGVLFATLVLRTADGTHKSRKVELPFSLPLKIDLTGEKKIAVMPCGVSVRQRKEGEAEAEATLKICIESYAEREIVYVAEMTEGEEYEKNESAISIYLPSAGDTLWQTAKALKKTPEEVEKTNPELKFPLTGNERILIYRQKTE